MQEQDAVKSLQLLLSMLMYELQTALIENKAYREITASDPAIDSRLTAILETPPYVALCEQGNALRSQAIQAVESGESETIAAAIGTLTGQLNQGKIPRRNRERQP